MIRQRSNRPRIRNAIRCASVAAVAGCVAGRSTATAAIGVHSAQSTRITLERKPCFGLCPVYLVSIAGDGSVVFDGRAHVDSAGRVTSHIDADRVATLVRLFDDSQFFTLDDKYVSGERNCLQYATDAPIVITSIAIGGRTKRVEHDLGCSGVPERLTLLEDEIDEIAGVRRWTTGQPRRR